MNRIETTGWNGAPDETLALVASVLRSFDLGAAQVVLVTDWQDRRASQRYALLVQSGTRTLVSAAAFGPRFGERGTSGLESLVRGLLDRGATNFKESVIAPHEFGRMLEEPTADEFRELLASANPVDPLLYLQTRA